MCVITRLSLGAGILLCAFAQMAVAQMSGRLEMAKTHYSALEPIEVVFTVKNIGTKPKEIGIGDPYGQCSAYKVSGLPRKEHKRGGPPPVAKEFENLQEVECLSSSKTLVPYEEYVERFRLDKTYDVNRPGKYRIEVTRVLPYGKAGVMPQGDSSLEASKKSFKFTVD